MVELKAHQTLIIPSGWIHAVYTDQDSIVFGGNFLHGLDMERQTQIHCLEVRTRVPERFRFPLFREMHFSAASMYLQKCDPEQPWPCWKWKPCPC
jgi:F-box/leucine-rich repeat protein 10/11